MFKLQNRVCLCTLNEIKSKIRVTLQFYSVSWYLLLASWQRKSGKSLNSVERINFLNEYFMFCERKKFALCFLMLLIVQFNISLFEKFLELEKQKSNKEGFSLRKSCKELWINRTRQPQNPPTNSTILRKLSTNKKKNKLCDIMCRNGKQHFFHF